MTRHESIRPAPRASGLRRQRQCGVPTSAEAVVRRKTKTKNSGDNTKRLALCLPPPNAALFLVTAQIKT
jgi:hypothetical protein